MKKLLLLLLFFVSNAGATAFTDLQFGQYQTADSQWNTSSCWYSPGSYSGCQIYSKNPGITYKIPWTSGRWTWQAGQYIKFVPSGNSSYPYTAVVYNSNGTVAGQLGLGKVIYAGEATNGEVYFFFMGSDNNTGQLFSISEGMDSTAGVTITKTADSINPTTAYLDSLASYGSTTPLAAGETTAPTGPTTTTVIGSSGGISQSQSSIKSAAQIRRDSYFDNGIYIEQVGNNNSIDILQQGNNNQIRGINQQRARMWGNYNTYDIRQGAPTSTGINLIEMMVDGNNNDLTLYQDRFDAGTADSSASGDNILRIGITGDSNTVVTNQRGEVNAGGHFGEIAITGDSNNVTLRQRSTISETAFIDVTGNSNVVNLLQQNTSNALGGAKFADIKLTGDGHAVNLTQNGTGAHSATIDLTYGSAPSTVNLLQQGSITQSYGLEQTCFTAGGCNITVTQGQ